MKDKILKAIDKGLMNVLSTDIEDYDIDFNSNDINNEYIPEISLDELNDMFNENKECIFNIKYDTTNAISLILDDDSEISLYQYEKSMNPVFLKISNDDLRKGHNEILIYVPENHLINDKLQWQTELQDDNYSINYEKYGIKNKNVINKDFNGYRNCKRISDIVNKNKKLGKISAIQYCLTQNKYGHQGYLPSIGQLMVLSDYLDLINYVLQKLGSLNKLSLKNDDWWSSTMYSYKHIWHLYYGTAYSDSMNFSLSVLPIFRFKKY